MDAWGSLTILIKKQEAPKQRKAAIRKNLRQRKESFGNENGEDEFEFPELSNAEMAVLKDKIRKEYRKAHLKKRSYKCTNFSRYSINFLYSFSLIEDDLRPEKQ